MHPSCPALVGSGYCEKHQKRKEEQRRAWRGPRKYDLREWRDGVRKRQLEREPLCRHCKANGLLVPATDVDHIDGDKWNDMPSNLQSLCHPCHSIKTAKQDGSFGRAPGRGGSKV